MADLHRWKRSTRVFYQANSRRTWHWKLLGLVSAAWRKCHRWLLVVADVACLWCRRILLLLLLTELSNTWASECTYVDRLLGIHMFNGHAPILFKAFKLFLELLVVINWTSLTSLGVNWFLWAVLSLCALAAGIVLGLAVWLWSLL